MARESYKSSTLGGPIPHKRVESEHHRHPYTMKLKSKFSFGPPQDRPFPCGTPPTLSGDTPSIMNLRLKKLVRRNVPYLPELPE